MFAFDPALGSFDHSIQVTKVLLRLVTLGQARPHFATIAFEFVYGFFVRGELVETRKVPGSAEEEQAEAIVRLGQLRLQLEGLAGRRAGLRSTAVVAR